MLLKWMVLRAEMYQERKEMLRMARRNCCCKRREMVGVRGRSRRERRVDRNGKEEFAAASGGVVARCEGAQGGEGERGPGRQAVLRSSRTASV